MTSDTFQRKLTAILSADVVGYSRLMGEDEAGTVKTLETYKGVMFSLIRQHRGRVVDSPGDNLLAEFGSVVDAVQCAVSIQKELQTHNTDLPENRRMEFRIGINLGDVITKENRIYGDGVNVAARIESLADAGGICLSRSAYDQVKGKISIQYDYLGKHEVKNIDEPVRVYKVLMDSMPDDILQKEKSKETVSTKKKTSGFSDKPSIAVLPFVNLSSDPEQEYFVDGLSEEILNSLAHIPDLTVIARTSSFSFKGTNKNIQEISSVLGVENILEGSVRKAGNALRITTQLVKGVDGSHLWSETYNRELKDIFDVQEDIATTVADELKLTLGIDKVIRKLGGTHNIEAYELFLIVQGQMSQETERGLAKYGRMLETIDKAIALDPEFAIAWVVKSDIHAYFVIFGPTIRADTEQDAALSAAQKAIELEPILADGYAALGACELVRGNWIDAELAVRKALELASGTLAGFQYMYFVIYYYERVGKFKRAHELLERMRRNDPLNTRLRGEYLLVSGLMGDMQRAEKEYEHGRAIFGDQWDSGNERITLLRLSSVDAVSRDEIVYSPPIFNAAKEHLDLPEEGLAVLHQLYNDYNNLSERDITDIMIWAACFGDPEFAMDAMEKAIKITAIGLFKIWVPVMQKVRQLPRFKEFVNEIGLVDFWNKFGWPDLCRPVGDDDFECD
jgi:adenylate cyclase